MLVRAHVNVAGLRAGQEYDLDPAQPGLAAALAAGWAEDVTPTPPRRRPPRPASTTTPPPAPQGASGEGSGSGSGSGDSSPEDD